MMLQTRLFYRLITSSPGKVTVDLSYLDKIASVGSVLDCLIVLNTKPSNIFFKHFVRAASNIVLVDGGANYIYQSPYRIEPTIFALIGDLDSVKPQVKAFYQNKHFPVISDTNQNTNDLSKALNLALNQNFRNIACLGLLGGRIDQQLANISTLQHYARMYESNHFIGLGESSLMYMVKPNIHTTIKLSQNCIRQSSGIVSFGTARVETEGYKWNLGQNHGIPELSWGRTISSSNVALGSKVKLMSSDHIFCTFEFTEINP